MGQIAGVAVDAHRRRSLVLPRGQILHFLFVSHKSLPLFKLARQIFAGDDLPVDNSRRRAGQAQRGGLLLRSADVVGKVAVVERGGEGLTVQPQFDGQINEELTCRGCIKRAPVSLTLKQSVVVLPEPVLCAGGLSGLGRLLGVGMDARQRKVTVDYLDIFGVSVCQTL